MQSDLLHLLSLMQCDRIPSDAAKRSIELFAEKLAPRFH